MDGLGASTKTLNHFIHCVVHKLLTELGEHIGLGVLECRLHRIRRQLAISNRLLAKVAPIDCCLSLLAKNPARAQLSDYELVEICFRRVFTSGSTIETFRATTGWLVLGLQTAEVQFYCDDRPAAQADKSAKP
jgi:hypothetical protein